MPNGRPSSPRGLLFQATMAVLACALAAPCLCGQSSAVESGPQRNDGLQLGAVSLYGMYYSTTFPAGGGFAAPAGLGADLGLGGSARLSLTHSGSRSEFFLLYTPSYTGRLRYSAWNSLNHAVSVGGARRFGKWRIAPALSTSVRNYEGFLFAPTTLSAVASTSATPAELSAALLSRSVQNTQLSAAVNSGSIDDAAARALLYGQRVLFASGRTLLSYAPSSRTSLTLIAGVTRNQSLDGSSANTRRLISKTTSVTGGISISYALAPQTQFGLKATTSRIVSNVYDAFNTNSTASVARSFRTHWVLQVYGGVGFTTAVRLATARQPSGPRPVGGASVAYRSYAHTLLGSFDRIVNDSYGAGAVTSSNTSASWRWEQRQSGWAVNASVTWQRLEQISLGNTSAWRVNVGWSKALGRNISFMAEYAYLDYARQVRTILYDRSQTAVRFSIVWRPPSVFSR